MSAPVYLGDEVTAAGFRLAGIDTVVPADGEETTAFDNACSQAPLVLLCASVAARIGEAYVRARVVASSPPVALLPSLAHPRPLSATSSRLRRELGLQA